MKWHLDSSNSKIILELSLDEADKLVDICAACPKAAPNKFSFEELAKQIYRELSSNE